MGDLGSYPGLPPTGRVTLKRPLVPIMSSWGMGAHQWFLPRNTQSVSSSEIVSRFYLWRSHLSGIQGVPGSPADSDVPPG